VQAGASLKRNYAHNNKQFLSTVEMNRYINIIAGLIIISAFISCDKIEPPYMETDTSIADTTECPVPNFPVITNHIKRILIEEYTGHYCVNCPTAAHALHSLQNTYGEKITVVAVHAGFFAEPEGGCYGLDLRCQTGEDLYSNFSITDNPAAMFNRKKIGGSSVFTSPAAWESVYLAADTTPVLDMQMINIYSEANNKVCIHIETEFLVQMASPLRISVFVTEDSIIGCQKNNNASVGPVPDITNYVFMHVLRGAVNGTWGSVLNADPISAGTKIISSFKLILNNTWVARNCHIVAFAYNPNTDEVLQSVQAKVTP
jgi:thiol-disulfide isomerase/thioredoxin